MISDEKESGLYRQYADGELTEEELREEIDMDDSTDEEWSEYLKVLGHSVRLEDSEQDFF